MLLFSGVLCGAQDFSDAFEVRRLDKEHFTIWDGNETIVNMGTRGCTIMSAGDSPATANIVYFEATDKAWEAEAQVVLYPTSKGGLALMQSREAYWSIEADYKTITARSTDGSQAVSIPNRYGRYLHLRLQYADGTLTLSAAPQKTHWTIVANSNPGVKRLPATDWHTVATLPCDLSGLTMDTGFSTIQVAPRIALLAECKDVVSFRDFWYRTK